MPKDASSRFPSFFAYLDEIKDSIGIDSYGVSVTTLEEVFLRIGLEDKVEREEKEEQESSSSSDNGDLKKLGKDKDKIDVALAHETKGHRFGQQVYAQLVKRATMYRRDIRGAFFTTVVPLALLFASIAVIGKTSTIVSTLFYILLKII